MSEVKQVDLKKWADIGLERWLLRVGNLHIRKSGNFIKSLTNHVSNEAAGDKGKVQFFFLYYGYYVDAGVGNGYNHKAGTGSRNELGQLSFLDKPGPHRKPKPWFQKIYSSEYGKLQYLLIDYYGAEAFEILKGIETIKI